MSKLLILNIENLQKLLKMIIKAITFNIDRIYYIIQNLFLN